MTKRDELLAVAEKIEQAAASWLPMAGHVKNITFKIGEIELLAAALRAAAEMEG